MAPLTQLTRKDQPFTWTKKCESCVQELKKGMTSTQVLTILEVGRSGLCVNTTRKSCSVHKGEGA